MPFLLLSLLLVMFGSTSNRVNSDSATYTSAFSSDSDSDQTRRVVDAAGGETEEALRFYVNSSAVPPPLVGEVALQVTNSCFFFFFSLAFIL